MKYWLIKTIDLLMNLKKKRKSLKKKQSSL